MWYVLGLSSCFLILACVLVVEQYESSKRRPLIDWAYDDAIKYDDDLEGRLEKVIIDKTQCSSFDNKYR
jgi:hypothetical protein